MESGIKMSPVSTEFPVYLTGYNFALKKSYSEGSSLQTTSGSLALLFVPIISFSSPAQSLQLKNNPCLMELCLLWSQHYLCISEEA